MDLEPKVENFINDLQSNGKYRLKVFIDGGLHSEEALIKYKQRQAKRIEECEWKIPFGIATLIGEAF